MTLTVSDPSKGRTGRPTTVTRRLDLSLALDLYGPLLTGRQAEALRLHHEEDLSYAEAAAEMGLTRQSAHEHVTAATETLARLEERLGLVRRYRANRRRLLSLAAGLRARRPAREAAADLERLAESL